MTEQILEKMQEMNALLWVLDLDKAELVLNDLESMLKKTEDPFLKKKIEKYKESYKERYIQLSQPEIDFTGNERNFTFEEEGGYFPFSDEFMSSLFIMKSTFELEIRFVITIEGELQYYNDIKEITNTDSPTKFESYIVEKSETSSLYSLSFSGNEPHFGEITFTRSGLGNGRIFFNQFSVINESQTYILNNVYLALDKMASKVYGLG